MDPIEKKRIIERRILRELSQYFEQHKDGLKIQILSAKYAIACQEIGGFPELIEEMRIKGLINIVYGDKGNRTVFLNGGQVTRCPGNNNPYGWF